MEKYYRFEQSEPRWFDFENHDGIKSGGAKENRKAKGHPMEALAIDEQKILCDFEGSGVVRRIWFTVGDFSPLALHNLILQMYWDNADLPQVSVPVGDFFCMGSGIMKQFENAFFSTAEGRSFCCFLPMPFRKHCKIVLCNQTGKKIGHFFYDVDVTLEKIAEDDMYFHTYFRDIPVNSLEEEVEILPKTCGKGRYLGTAVAIFPDTEKYGTLWWGEGEVKFYLDDDGEYPTMAGTGTEDYLGSAWGLEPFINRTQGCVYKDDATASMYRFHADDPICFQKNIRVTLQAMGGGMVEKVQDLLKKGVPCVPVSCDNDDLVGIYGQKDAPLEGYVNFFRQDHYRVTAYYYSFDK